MLPAFAYSSEVTTNDLLIKKISNHPEWKALLHYKKNTFYITSPQFLYSSQEPNLTKELTLNIEHLQTDPNYICRFPARAMWIQKNFEVEDINTDYATCPSLLEFFKKAPADTISLIFASENLSSPSSMMGHSFLKIAGQNYKNEHVEHAISYFTILDSINPFGLIYDSLITGMPGKFALLPYSEQLKNYHEVENRNIWEYTLALTEFERKLIYYHLWELKDIPTTYYFTNYNCATLTHFLLAIVKPDLLNHDDLWITPSDVIKQAVKHKLITQKSLMPSDKWAIKLLLNKSPNANAIIKNMNNKKSANPFLGISADKLTEFDYYFTLYYINLLQKEHQISDENWVHATQIIQDKIQYKHINLGSFKSPELAPNDSQLEVGLKNDSSGNNQFIFRIMPAAHTLKDDNRQYFTENELRLADIELSYNPKNHTVDLNHWTLYSTKTLTTRDTVTGGISGQWRFGVDKLQTKIETHVHALNMSGGIGLTYKIHKDIDLYSMLNIGVWGNTSQGHAYIEPELGIIMREIWNMKTLFNIKHTQTTKMANSTSATLTQALYYAKDHAIFLTLKNSQYSKSNIQSIQFSLTHYF